jgi:hypothetical protein
VTALDRYWARAAHPCRCGHSRLAHNHHRDGTDCGLCRCDRFKRDWLAAAIGALT